MTSYRFAACALVLGLVAFGRPAQCRVLLTDDGDARFERRAHEPEGIRVGPNRGEIMPDIHPSAVVWADGEWQVVVCGRQLRTGSDIGHWRIMAIAPGLIDVQHGLLAWQLPVPRP